MSAAEKLATRSAEPEIVLQHYRRIEERHDDVEDTKAAESASIADAAASGVNIKALKHARKVINMGPRDGKTYLDDLAFYVNLISGGMMGQEELFGDENAAGLDDSLLAVQRRWNEDREAERTGYAAGKNGEPVDNNAHQQGTSQHDKWARAWADGHEEYEAARGSEIAPRTGPKRPEDLEDPEESIL